jgi:hypothetical protein
VQRPVVYVLWRKAQGAAAAVATDGTDGADEKGELEIKVGSSMYAGWRVQNNNEFSGGPNDKKG